MSFNILFSQYVDADHKIHVHCFTGSWAQAETWLIYFKNSFIGLTPKVTQGRSLHHLVSQIPLDRLLLETDSPYFVPETVSSVF